MKRGLLFLVCGFLFGVAGAQYCGQFGNPSGPNQCAPTGLTQSGFSPKYDSLPPVTNCVSYGQVIEFKNYDTIYFGGQNLVIQWLRFDSIGNLPDGICWATDKTNNTFNSGQTGCIKLMGNPCAAPGQYRLEFWITSKIGGMFVHSNPIDNGPDYFVRVKNPQDADTPVDTTQLNSQPFIPYGAAPLCADCIYGISEGYANPQFTISPNPTTTQLNITIDETLTGAQLNIYSITGALVKTELLLTVNSQLSTVNLPSGVYIAEVKTREVSIKRRWVKM